MNKPSRTGREQPYIALIGDMVGSRLIPASKRRGVQNQFSELTEGFNRVYQKELRAKFVITLGDEFQALISRPQIIPEVIWRIGVEYSYPVRLGFGYGVLTTDVPEYAINVDGPALHQARSAILLAKKEKLLGGVFQGFGSLADTILNGLARLLQFHRETRTRQQIKIISLLRQQHSQSEIAEQLRLTRQTVSKHVQAAGWVSYRQGEDALQAALSLIKI